MTRVLLFLVCAACLSSSADAERALGEFTGYMHDVGGSVFAVDGDGNDGGSLVVRDFRYDGLGPDVFFYVGKSADGPGVGRGLGQRGPDSWRLGRGDEPLGPHDGETVTLALPPGVRAASLGWISVWCRRFRVNFGDLVFRQKQKKMP